MQRLSGFPFAPWFLDRVRRAKRLVLMTHVSPDGDGLGCQVAFCAAARRAGVEASVVNEDPWPDRYDWLDPDRIAGSFDADASALESADLGLVFDTHHPARAGRPYTRLRERGVDVLVFDHHAVAPELDVQGVVATEFSSTGELCYRLIEALGWPLDQHVARGLYAAISFDTGSFRYLRNQSETLRVAATLLDTGLDTNPIQEALFASRPAAETRLLARVLDKLQLSEDGRVAWVIAPAGLADGLAVGEDAFGEVIPFIIGVQGVVAAALLKPGRAAGEWKLSLRSKTAAEIGHIAATRGGGGHAHAAGATLSGEPGALMAEIVAEMELAVKDAR